MKWNTAKIVADLKALLGDAVQVYTNSSPEGGCYCRDIYIERKDDVEDGISVIGFNTDDISDVDIPNEDIKQVEIRNFGSDSEGGLQTDDMVLRQIYYAIHDYFRKFDVTIVRQLKDYF